MRWRAQFSEMGAHLRDTYTLSWDPLPQTERLMKTAMVNIAAVRPIARDEQAQSIDVAIIGRILKICEDGPKSVATCWS